MRPRVEKIAVKDSAGNRRVVTRATPFIDVAKGQFSGVAEWQEGMPIIHLDDGRLIQSDGDEFVIRDTGERFRRA